MPATTACCAHLLIWDTTIAYWHDFCMYISEKKKKSGGKYEIKTKGQSDLH